MNTVKVSTDPGCTISNAVPRKTPPHLPQYNHAVMNNSNLFRRSGPLTIYSILHVSALLLVPNTPMKQSFPLQDWMYGYLQSFKTLLPKIFAEVGDRSIVMMASGSCCNWLQATFSVQFVDLLTIESPKNSNIVLPFDEQNSDVLSMERDAIFVIQPPSTGSFTSPATMKGRFNAWDWTLAMILSALWLK